MFKRHSFLRMKSPTDNRGYDSSTDFNTLEYHSKTTIDKLEEYITNFNIDADISSLKTHLSRIEISIKSDSDNDAILHLVNNRFFHSLGGLPVSEIPLPLFDQQTTLFKRVLPYVLKTDNLDEMFLANLCHTLQIYLEKFCDHQQLVGYQKMYFQRLLSDITNIFGKFPICLNKWIKSVISQQSPFLVFEYLKELVFEDNVNLLTDDFIALTSLTNLSEQFSQYLTYKSCLIDFFPDLFTNSFTCSTKSADTAWLQKQKSDNSNDPVNIFVKNFKIFCSILKVIAPDLSSKMFEEFQQKFLPRLLDSTLNKITLTYTFSIIKVLGEERDLSEFVDKLLSNNLLQKYFGEIIHSYSDYEEFLSIIDKLVSSHDIATVRLFGEAKNETATQPTLLEQHPIDVSVESLRIKVMKISIESCKNIQHEYLKHFQRINEVAFFPLSQDKMLTKFYLGLCLTFFTNEPPTNTELLSLTRAVCRKMNVYENSDFRLIIDYLFESFMAYHHLIKAFEVSRFDSLELEKIFRTEYIVPNIEFINKIGVVNYNEILYHGKGSRAKFINFISLIEKLDQFKVFITDVYIISKVKNLSYKNSNKTV